MTAELLPLLADIGSGGHGHMNWDGGWWVGMVLVGGLVILGIVWAVREFARPRARRDAASNSDAAAILDRRLASGELSPEEYRERRATLRDGAEHSGS